MNIRAWLNTVTTRSYAMPIVILYVTEGCNLRCTMCSYRTARPDELSLAEIATLAERLSQYGLRHIVYSGGEPLLRGDFPSICAMFSAIGVRQTLLTNGLLLEKRFTEIAPHIGELIVSLDGPDAPTHDGIRGRSFEQIVRGIRVARGAARTGRRISIRTVVQKHNFRALGRMVDLAESLGVDRISFLAADAGPDAFGRNGGVSPEWAKGLLLDEEEAKEFREIAGALAASHRRLFASGFISESPAKLFRLVEYFEALAGSAALPPNRCNAPNVSAVITSTGEIRPCFFLPGFGNVRENDLHELHDAVAIRSTRRKVRDALQARCNGCVCTLRVSPVAALADRF